MVSNSTPSRINPGSRANAVTTSNCQACSHTFDQRLLEDGELAQAWAALPRRRLAAGQLLVQPGDEAHATWRVETGLIRAYYLAEDGQARNRSFYMAGHWIGVGSPPRPSATPYAVEALEATTLTELPYAQMHDWLQRPDLHQLLTETIDLAIARREAREESLLLKDASQRYLDFLAQDPLLAERVPLHHVASHLGITNVALSRIRRKLKAQGLMPHAARGG